MLTTKQIGDTGEYLAVEFLTLQGFVIIDRNYRTRFGEIDIIARDNDYLVFVEVKKKSSHDFGHPGEMITQQKIEKIKKTALFYLQEIGYDGHWRIDAVLITGDNQPEHVKNISL